MEIAPVSSLREEEKGLNKQRLSTGTDVAVAPGRTATAHLLGLPNRQGFVVSNGTVGHRFVELGAAIPCVACTVLGEEPRTPATAFT